MRSVIPLIVAFSSVVGCTSDPASPSAGDDESNLVEETGASSLSATIEKDEIRNTDGKCTISFDAIKVSLPNASATKVINDELKVGGAFPDWVDCKTEEFTAEGGMTAAFNERGLLSVTSTSHVTQIDAAYNSFTAMNFDLATGKLLSLDDVVDAAGREIIVKECAKGLGVGVEHLDLEPDLAACADAVDPSNGLYTLETGGLRIYAVLSFEGALVKWDALAGHITNPVVEAISR